MILSTSERRRHGECNLTLLFPVTSMGPGRSGPLFAPRTAAWNSAREAGAFTGRKVPSVASSPSGSRSVLLERASPRGFVPALGFSVALTRLFSKGSESDCRVSPAGWEFSDLVPRPKRGLFPQAIGCWMLSVQGFLGLGAK